VTALLTIAIAIRAYSYRYANETELQEQIAEALERAGIPAVREVILSPRDRIDLLAQGVGIEVKVAGRQRDVLGQLERYAAHDEIEALILVTNRARHMMPDAIGGKPLETVSLICL